MIWAKGTILNWEGVQKGGKLGSKVGMGVP